MFRRATGIVIGVALTGLLLGCSAEEDPNRTPTQSVTGVVTYQGKPVSDATVTFSPAEPGGTAAFGRTDEEGNYLLTTFESDDGAIAGRYKVMVQKVEQAAATKEATEEEYVPPGALVGKAPPGPKSLVPQKYSSPTTSDLEVEVKEGDNTLNIDLKD